MNRPSKDTGNEPFYPILSLAELGSFADLRHHLPSTTQEELAEDDHVVHIVTPEIKPNRLRPSALREIMRLTRVQHPDAIGQQGPAVASLASIENCQIDALRKFEKPHGRDALRIALDLHEHHPELLRSTLLTLAETQGTVDEEPQVGIPMRQEQCGRIILLDRDSDDPIGKKFSKHLNWGWPFYASIDATPTFIQALRLYQKNYDNDFLSCTYYDKDGTRQTMQKAFDRAANWLIDRLDENPEGFLEFKNRDPSGGMASQSWKDSAFAYLHANGERANHLNGIASVEVQALAYDSLIDMAELSHASHPAKSAEFSKKAERLKNQIFSHFWIDDPRKGGYFALATDRDNDNQPRPLAVRSSNMGHLLNSRLLTGSDPSIIAMRDSTIRQLFSPELLHYSGIRTLAADEKGFRPGSYHTGPVWLWDTAYIANGLEKHGFDKLAWELRERIWRTVEQSGSFPEFVNGKEDNQITTNQSEIYVWNKKYNVLHLFEQPPQEIQGWTVSAILAMKYKYRQYKTSIIDEGNNLETAILSRLTRENPPTHPRS